MKKMPPIQKIYEAWTALADGRIALEGDPESVPGAAGKPGETGKATVSSSDASKTYTVSWDGDRYASTDNATYWQGYPGYPVIAVLMLQHRIPYDESIAQRFSGIAWKKINDAHKRDYDAALDEVFSESGMSPSERAECEEQARQAYDALASLDLVMKRKL
jgi:hypothetical protein